MNKPNSKQDDIREQVANYIREFIADMEDEAQWEASFKKTKASLIAATRKAKQEIAEGKAFAMDCDQL